MEPKRDCIPFGVGGARGGAPPRAALNADASTLRLAPRVKIDARRGTRAPWLRAWIWWRLWSLAAWFAARRPARASVDEVERHRFRTQTRGMGLALTDWLRDRLRPRWLRVQGAVASDPVLPRAGSPDGTSPPDTPPAPPDATP